MPGSVLATGPSSAGAEAETLLDAGVFRRREPRSLLALAAAGRDATFGRGERVNMLGRFLANLMAPDPKFRRRTGIVLLLAALLVLAGGSLLVPKTGHPLLVLVWFLVCLALLILTLVVALIDMRLLRRAFSLKKRELFLSTFRDEEFQKKLRAKGRALIIEEEKPPDETSADQKE